MSDTDDAVRALRRLRAEGAGFSALIEALRRDDGFRLTPLRLMWAFQEAFGLPWVQFRDHLLECLGPDLRPLVPEEEVERRAEELLSRYMTRER
ncbi:hypothetical protein QRN89_18890 [Streptomyces chengbuensis]|uniref:hypothetical protein n=1 Tax=Streptomyces TaxID=1883 RepID=UPI0025B4D300|nr:hypothetical protein [Streptomyces sp. HUAS CB01]WJY51681.1 hypothetical protein QRN89_18890 [Streptomyces sp. HUAS CB01]